MVSYFYIHFGVRRERVSKFRRKKTLEDTESEERERREREREIFKKNFQFFFSRHIDILFLVSVCEWYHIFTFTFWSPEREKVRSFDVRKR